MAQQLTDDVLVVETSIAEGKAGVIAGERIALAIDAGNDDADGAAILRAARSLERPEVQLVYTHGHADHALGGTAFRGLVIVGRPGIVEHMSEQVESWAAHTGEGRNELEARLGWPTSIVPADAELDLGGRSVVLLDTPGHAPDALCVLEPRAGILFGGDTIVTAIPPAFNDGDGATLEATLRRLADLDVETLVPGHGEVLTGRSTIRQAIIWAADYLARCLEHVLAHPNMDVEELVAAAGYDDLIGPHLARARHGMAARHQRTIRVMATKSRGRDRSLDTSRPDR